MTLPYDPNGYAVDEQTGEIHRRWAKHARGLRRTTSHGLYTVLGDLAPRVCVECWPPVRKTPSRPRRPDTLSEDVAPYDAAEPLTVTSESIDLTDTEDGS